MEDLKKCCFCDKGISYLEQNNPSPANTNPDAVCCIDCNYNIVLPARSIIDVLVRANHEGTRLKAIPVPDYSEMLTLIKAIRSDNMNGVNKEVLEDGTIQYSLV